MNEIPKYLKTPIEVIDYLKDVIQELEEELPNALQQEAKEVNLQFYKDILYHFEKLDNK